MKKFTILLVVCMFLFINQTNAQTFTNYTVESTQSLCNNYVNAIAIDAKGNKWFGTQEGLSKFDGTNWTTYNTSDGLASSDVNAIAIDAEGNKWVAYDYPALAFPVGVSKFDDTTWTTYDTLDGLADDHVNAIAIDSEGNKWFGCGSFYLHYGNSGGGVSKFDGTTWTTYTTSDGLVNNEVRAIAIDAEGNKWFGTWGGVSKFDGTTWTTYTTADGLAGDIVDAIAIDGSNNIWITCFYPHCIWFDIGCLWAEYGSGVSKFDGTTWITYTMEDGLIDSTVNAIAIDAEGNKWFGTRNGVTKFDDITWTTYTTSDGLVNNSVNAIAIDAEGNKWFGTDGGISKLYDEGTTVNISVSPSNQNVGFDAGSTTFSVSSNAIWTISNDASWLTASRTSVSGNGTITANFIANTSTSPRVATITVYGPGINSQYVTVSQSGNPNSSVASLYDLKAIIYPNPAADIINIEISKTGEEEIIIELLTVSGQVIYRKEYKNSQNPLVKQIDLSGYAKGVYFVRIRQEGAVYNGKIIVM